MHGGAVVMIKNIVICISLLFNCVLATALINKELSKGIKRIAAYIVIPILYPTDPVKRYYCYQGIEPYLDFIDGKSVNVLDYSDEDRKNKEEIRLMKIREGGEMLKKFHETNPTSIFH